MLLRLVSSASVVAMLGTLVLAAPIVAAVDSDAAAALGDIDALSDDNAPAAPRAWLGVLLQPITPEIAEAMTLPDERGALVGDVDEGSPAEKAGLRKGDVILRIDGRAVEAPSDLVREVRDRDAGDAVRIDWVRDGRETTENITLAALRDPRFGKRMRFARPVDPDGPLPPIGGPRRAALGLQLLPMEDDLAAYFGANGGDGALVTRVEEGSAAERAGMKAGDVIQKIDGARVEDPSDVASAMRSKDPGDTLALTVLRERRERDVEVIAGAGERLARVERRHMRRGPHHGGRFDERFEERLHGLRGQLRRLPEELEWRMPEARRRMDEQLRRMRADLDRLREEIRELRGKLR
jgi:membrane-associated protease RseP (regulator of RpoE activity)